MSNLDVPPARRDVRKLLCIDISGVMVRPEPYGNGHRAHVEGDITFWTRGATEDEAVGALIRRLAVEHQGANWRREQKEKEESRRRDNMSSHNDSKQVQKCSCGHDLYMLGKCRSQGCWNDFGRQNKVAKVSKVTDRAAVEVLIRSEVGPNRDLEDYTESDFDTASIILSREGWRFVANSPCTCVDYNEDIGHSPSCGWYPA